ncbi:MAG: DNA polymerase IV [Acidobacteria bacterium]|nr:DNA polymerase IV [Acidobacteriota bacterium]
MVEHREDAAEAPARKIIHVDMDAFYASVEQRDDPALRGRPVIVAWEGPRSVVCAASYEARKFGVRSAIPALRARKLCPEGVFVPPHFEKYRAVSSQVGEIFRRHTPLVEFLSLDEAYLDVTVELTGLPSATETATVIRREIRDETGLTASAGVAPNKFLAKIASDWKKPDGLFVIRPMQVDAFLVPLPVGKIPGVGKATEAILAEMGIATIGDVRERSEESLVKRLGTFGHRLCELARGIDRSPVVAEHETKSVSIENTFSRDLTLEEISEELRSAIPRFWERMSRKGLIGRTVTVKLRAADFRTATRRMTLPCPPASGDELFAAGAELLGRFEFGEGTLYRLVGIGLSNFGPVDEPPQRELFG